MKLFLKRLAGVTFFSIILFFLALQCLSWFNKKLLKQYKTDPVYNTVMLGDSHVHNAIDDSQLPSVLNLAQPGEAFIFSYAKLKLILESHPNIKRVLLGCSYHNLSSYYEQMITGKHSASISRKYFFLLPAEEQFWLLWNKKENSIAYLRGCLKTGYYNITNPYRKYSFIRDYYNSLDNAVTCVNMDTVKKRINKLYHPEEELSGFSSINILYLNKIFDLCKDTNVELSILNTPLATSHKKLVPQKFKDKLSSLVESKANLIEFDSVSLTDSCFLADGEHLTRKGAIIVTDYLRTFLEKK